LLMKGLSATTIVIASMLLMGTVTTSQFAFADGNDSPAECLGGPTDDWMDSEMMNTYDAGIGNAITAICIKDGDDAFGMSQHSGLIDMDGTFGDGDLPNTCYEVTFMNAMQEVKVKETGADGCMNVSHVDFFVGPGDMVGGHGGITDNTALLVSGSHLTASWMIPLLVSAIGIGVFVVTRK